MILPASPRLYFEWDENKNIINLEKHGIAFESALKVFFNKNICQSSDRNDESRYKIIGLAEGRIITVIFTRRSYAIRIISARKARKKEEAEYGEIYFRESSH